MISDYKKVIIVALILYLFGCSSVTGKIHNTEFSNREAKRLYNAYEKMTLYEIGEIQLIGGGDVEVTFTVEDEQIIIDGASSHGMILTGKKLYLADPFDEFFDINYEIRNKHGLINYLMGINENDIYLYDANSLAEIYSKEWQSMKELHFDVYFVGKNVSIDDLDKGA